MKKLYSVLFGAALLMSVASTACLAPASGRVYVRVGPPAPVYEVRAVSPGPGFVWIEGYHRWDGRAYIWTPGRWERPPRPRAAFVPGHWASDRRGYYWVEGHWR
jgi:hypothetical protein